MHRWFWIALLFAGSCKRVEGLQASKSDSLPSSAFAPSSGAGEGSLRGFADFEVEGDGWGECFVVRLQDPARIAQARLLLSRPDTAYILVGKLARTDGGFNQCGSHVWNWHIPVDSVDFAEMSIELCDGRPSYIEQNLSYWIDTVGRFCPWSGRLRRERSSSSLPIPR